MTASHIVPRNIFRAILAFDASHFLAYLLSPFLIKTLEQFLVRQIPLPQAIQMVLPQEVELGSHTNILLISERLVRTHIWAHPAHRPWGMAQPQQCSECHILQPWKPKFVDNSVLLRCRKCKHEVRFQQPDGLVLFAGDPVKKSAAGVWYLKDVDL
jgi:hypothetical protein